MLNIGAIQQSASPLASPVVLVHKKDCSLWFFIDLRKLNNQTIKDVQSLPGIEDSLGCLDGATVFTSLDLQSWYWQVELTEAWEKYISNGVSSIYMTSLFFQRHLRNTFKG